MQDLVSNRWIRVVAVPASMSVVSLVFVLQGFPWAGLLWGSLALSAAFWAARRTTDSIAQVIENVEAENVSGRQR